MKILLKISLHITNLIDYLYISMLNILKNHFNFLPKCKNKIIKFAEYSRGVPIVFSHRGFTLKYEMDVIWRNEAK